MVPQAPAHVRGDGLPLFQTWANDPLTGLCTRQTFVAAMHSTAATGPGSFALALVNLDAFRRVNDAYGHDVGDELLVAVARRLADAVDPDTLLARWSGDEFAIFCPARNEHAQVLAARVHMALAEPFVMSGHRLLVGATIGIAVVQTAEDGAVEPARLLRTADAALAAAKTDRRGAWVIFDTRNATAPPDQSKSDSELRHALKQAELRVAYQPIVDLADGRVLSAEALVRWQHPERGLVTPAEFIDLAESTGLVVELGRQVLARAIADGAALAEQGHPLRIAVNLSPRHVASPGFIDELAMALYDGGLDGRLLGLELTETALAEDGDDLVRSLRDAADLGVTLLLDDFGTGWSSFLRLMRLPFHVVKLDRAFVGGLPDDAQQMVVAQAVITAARGLGKSVIAEGVETEATAAALRAMGCEAAQGFLYGAPMPPAQLLALLR